MSEGSDHWDAAYSNGDQGVSWFQEEASASLERILRVAAPVEPVVDIGGGSSRLVDGLLDAGFEHVTVLDISDSALELSRDRLGQAANSVEWVAEDLLEWNPTSAVGVWHDRAVFHFLVDDDVRDRYRDQLLATLKPGGHAVLGVFAEDGPEKCSGLAVRRHSQDELIDWLGAGFEIVEQSREVHSTPGGNPQPFNWIVARRAPQG